MAVLRNSSLYYNIWLTHSIWSQLWLQWLRFNHMVNFLLWLRLSVTPHQSLLELHVQLSTIHTAFCIIRGSSLASPIYCLWYSFSLMAPILKPGGIPVNQYTQTYPLINCLCCCQDCLSHTVVDPISKAVYQGSYVSPAQRKDHQNWELARGIASI